MPLRVRDHDFYTPLHPKDDPLEENVLLVALRLGKIELDTRPSRLFDHSSRIAAKFAVIGERCNEEEAVAAYKEALVSIYLFKNSRHEPSKGFVYMGVLDTSHGFVSRETLGKEICDAMSFSLSDLPQSYRELLEDRDFTPVEKVYISMDSRDRWAVDELVLDSYYPPPSIKDAEAILEKLENSQNEKFKEFMRTFIEQENIGKQKGEQIEEDANKNEHIVEEQ